jgi:penicillin-binding protein 1A
MALGAGAVTPLQIATGYGVFANGGYRVEPYVISKVIDAQGNITVGTPTVQTIKTLKPLANITNLLPIQFA